MHRFEYKVIPAPKRGEKARGVKTTEDRFAYALMSAMNELGAEGWDYVRADALPCEERAGFTSTKTTYVNVLVFRRQVPETAEQQPAVWLNSRETSEAAQPRLGPAELPPAGKAPALGPAIPTEPEEEREDAGDPQPAADKA